MKITQWFLKRFGPFTDVTLDLSAGSEGLHLIYGLNEAGKSTALRALRALLYGFEERTADDWLHPSADLRVGAVLRLQDGREIAFLRRKGRKGTLLDLDSQAPRPDSDLEPFLCGTDRQTFARLYSMDQRELREGGQEILQGKGDLGTSLFGAGMGGVARLKQVRQRLEQESEALFKPRGHQQHLTAEIQKFKDLQHRVKELQLKADDWRRVEAALEDAHRRHAADLAAFEALKADLARAERLMRLAPLVAELREAEAALAGLADVRLLRREFSEERAAVQAELRAAQTTADDLKRRMDALSAELERLQVSQEVLQAAEQIEALHAEIGGIRQTRKDLQARRIEKARADEEVRALCRDLWPDRSDGAPPDLPTTQQSARIRKLATRYATLQERLASATRATEKARRDLASVRHQAGALPPPRDPSDLSARVRRIQHAGDLEAEIARLERDRRSQEKRLLDTLGRLGLTEDLDTFVQRRFPLREAVEDFEARFAELDRADARAEEERERLTRERDDAITALRAMALAGPPPTEEDLRRARERRDAGWRRVREAWEQRLDAGVEAPEYDPDRPLADAFEAAVAQADEVSDRLRREAARVQEHATRTATQMERDEALARLERESQERQARRRDLEAAWAGLWQPTGVTPRTPREMLAVLASIETAMEHARSVREERDRIAGLKEQVARHLEELSAALGGLAEPVVEAETLARRLDRAERIANDLKAVEEQRKALAARQADLEREVETCAAEQASVQRELDALEQEWAQAKAACGLDLTPDTAGDVLDRVANLQKWLAESQDKARRIRGMEANLEAFEGRARGLVQGLSGVFPGPVPEDPAAAVERLWAVLTQAREAESRRNARMQELEAAHLALQEAEARRSRAEADLARLLREAGGEDPSRLPELEEKSRQARDRREKVEGLRLQIRRESGGKGPDEVEADLAREDLAALAEKCERLPSRIAQQREALDALNREIGSVQQQRESLREGAPAVDPAEEAAATLARIRELVSQFAVLHLAKVVLDRGVEGYLERRKNPILLSAGRFFHDLTGHKYRGLASGFDDDGKPVLHAVQADGRSVPAEVLSDGTRDQLYLALRLASLLAHIEKTEPMPLVLDDLFVQFDDERTFAGLRVLADLSARVQVLVFTHHHRLVEMASDASLAGHVFVHPLGAGL